MPPASFPAKLAQVLHTRWAAGKPGVIVLACELIDHNGEELLRIMNQYVSDWGWEDEFAQWMANDCTVCTTLVDTIVPGRIRDRAPGLRGSFPGRARALPDVGHPGR